MDEKEMLKEYQVLCSRLNPDERSLLGAMLLIGDTVIEDSEVEGHMSNDYLIYQNAQYRLHDLRQEASEYRQANAGKKTDIGFFQRVSWGVGDFLIGVGRRMRGKVATVPTRR